MSGGMESMSEEQAADLAALQAGAAAVVSPVQAAQEAQAAQAEQEAQAEQATLADEFEMVAGAALAVLSVPYPSLSGIWTDDAKRQTAQALAAVFHKHGWLAGGFMSGYGPEVALLVTAGPLVVASVGAAKQDTERRKLVEAKKAADAAGHFAITRGTGDDDKPAGPEDRAPAVQVGTVLPEMVMR